MSCSKTLSIKPAVLGDSPFDGAVLFNSPAAGGEFIWAVRGPYVFKVDSTSGQIISSAKVDQNLLSRTCIAYDSTNDRLKIAGRWTAFPGVTTHLVLPPIPAGNIYTVHPGTLAVESTVNLRVLIGISPVSASSIGVSVMRYMGAGANQGIYGWFTSNNNCVPFRYLPPAADIDSTGTNTDTQQDLAWDASNERYWFTDSSDDAAYIYDSTFNQLDIFNSWGDDATTLFGIEATPVNDDAYAGTWNGQVKHLHYNSGTFTISKVGSNILTGSTKAIYRIRHNPYDLKLYALIVEDNSVAVIDPATDTLSSLKTGFDLPVDIVFSSTKKWVVQWGNTGLKELT